MVDAAPRNIGDVQQAVNAAQINKSTIIGDVFHDTLDLLAFQQVLHDFIARFGTCLFHNGTTRNDNIAATAIHFQDLERLRCVHQRGDVAHRTNIDLAARQEGRSAIKVNGKAAFDATEDNTLDTGIGFEVFFQLDPAFFATRFVARQHRFAHGVFNAVEEYFDFVTDIDISRLSGHGELAQRHAAFRFQSHIDNRQIIFNGRHTTTHHRSLKRVIGGKAFFQQGCKIIN